VDSKWVAPEIKNASGHPLPDPVLVIIKRLFAGYRLVVVEKEFEGGFGGGRVFLVRPVRDVEAELPTVVKTGPTALIQREHAAWQKCIQNKLFRAADIEGEPVYLSDVDQGGVRYRLVGGGVDKVESLHDFCRHASTKDVLYVLKERLFEKCMRPLWHLDRTVSQFDFSASYDHVLPVNLLLVAAAPPPKSLTVLRQGHCDVTSIQAGDYVRLEGFVVTKVDPVGKSVTLNLPAAADRSSGCSFASCRLRLQSIEQMEMYQAGQTVDAIEAVAVATRRDQLRRQAEETWPGDLGKKLEDDRITLPDDTVLPNPLAALAAFANKLLDVKVAHIHGDLSLQNVLVDPDARDVHIIDFAEARQDHVLHDFLRLETGIVTKLVPEALAEAGSSVKDRGIRELYERLHQAMINPDRVAKSPHAALEKPFRMLVAIRRAAHDYLCNQNGWDEYYRGLIYYLLGALKFDDLDTPAKQAAFWGAAVAQDLLEPQRRPTHWKKLARHRKRLAWRVGIAGAIVTLLALTAGIEIGRWHPLNPGPVVLADPGDRDHVGCKSPDPGVFVCSETNIQSHGGAQSELIDYTKRAPYQYFSISVGKDWREFVKPVTLSTWLYDATTARDWAYDDATLRMWVYGKATFLLKLQDTEGREAEIAIKSATDPDDWNLLCFELPTTDDQFDMRHVEDLLIFPAPGDPTAAGSFYLDEITLSSAQCPPFPERFEGNWKWYTPHPSVIQWRETRTKMHSGNESLEFNLIPSPSVDFPYINTEMSPGWQDFSRAKALQVWTHGEVTLLLKVKGEKGEELEVGTQSATNPNGWSLLCFDYTHLSSYFNLSEVKSLFFFPSLGDSRVEGTFYLDDFELSAGGCPSEY
jgi:hypothetical protein